MIVRDFPEAPLKADTMAYKHFKHNNETHWNIKLL